MKQVAAARRARRHGLRAGDRRGPLCHPLALTAVDVALTARRWGYVISATVRTTGPTGVEMEALTAVSVACLTIYDMLKAAERGIVIESIRLVSKEGGKSGVYLIKDRESGRLMRRIGGSVVDGLVTADASGRLPAIDAITVTGLA